MKNWEKVFVLFSIIYVTPLIFLPSVWPACLIDYFNLSNSQALYISMVLFGCILGVGCIVLTLQDLFKREFTNTSRKVWFLVLLLGGTPGWLIYLFVHGFRPRINNSELKTNH
jgi:hypothetical protein